MGSQGRGEGKKTSWERQEVVKRTNPQRIVALSDRDRVQSRRKGQHITPISKK